MTSRKRSGIAIEEQIYRSTPALRQTRFSSRRKTIHRKSDAPGLPLKNQQSTLTQLDFLRLPLLDSEDEEVIVRDSEEETESEVEEDFERPRKRRRQSIPPPSSNTMRQSTMTQAFPRLPLSFDSDDDDVPGVELSSGDYTELSEREDMVKNSRLDEWVTTQHARRDTEGHPNILDFSPPPDFERPPSSIPEIFSSSPTRPGRDGLAISRSPKTPKRFRVLEVPSSQTPPSTPLSTQQTIRRFTQKASPLKRKSTNMQVNNVSPTNPLLQRSPLKELSMNIQGSQLSSQKASLQVMFRDSGKIHTSSKQSIVSESPLKDKTPSAPLIEETPEKLREDNAPITEAAMSPQEESPTKRRVREFNARYAALSRQGSGLSSRHGIGPIQRGKVIRSSTGFTSVDDGNVELNRPPQPVETQFTIGEETQAIMGAIDLACEGVIAPSRSNILLQVEDEDEEIPLPPRRRSPSLHRQHSSTAEEDLSAGVIESGTNAEILMESQIKEEQLSMFTGIDARDFGVSNVLGRSGEEESQEPKERLEEEEERVPSSQNEQDEAHGSRQSQVFIQDIYIKKEQNSGGRTIQESQYDDIDVIHDEDSQSIHGFPTGSMEEASLDPASEQLLRETQAFAWHTSSNPPVAVQVLSPPAAPAAQMFPQPPIRSTPTQATTVDETQADASHRTQNHLPGSPFGSTQSPRPFPTHLLRISPQRVTRPVLVPSSPVPLPPGGLCSSQIEAPTPRTMRFLSRKPVTVSQLIPESLRDDGSIPQPPMWTQDEDEEEDDDDEL
jgi:hypothetical protein